MAKKVKFPLKMKDGADVRTIEELKEHFDFESVLEHYTSGKLLIWLNDRYYEAEAAKLSALQVDDTDFKKQLCEIFGIFWKEDVHEELNIDIITNRNEKKDRLLKVAPDAELLQNIDSVALTQNDLMDCLHNGVRKIYLIGNRFIIPLDFPDVEYVGIQGAFAVIQATDNVNFKEKNLKFTDMYFIWDTSRVTPEDQCYQLEQCLMNGTSEKMEELMNQALELANPRALMILLSLNAEEDDDEIKQLWETGRNSGYVYFYPEKYDSVLKDLADHGNAIDALSYAMLLYQNEDVEEDDYLPYIQKAAEGGCCLAMIMLLEEIEDEIPETVLAAFEHKNPVAQYKLGRYYEDEDSDDEAMKWYRKAAEQDHLQAQKALANLFDKDYPEAMKWYLKAVLHQTSDEDDEQTVQDAQNELIACVLSDTDESVSVMLNVFRQENPDKAKMKWLFDRADEEDEDACFLLAVYYSAMENYEETVRWLLKTAESGESFHTAKQITDCFPDAETGMTWLLRAFGWGYEHAIEMLSIFMLDENAEEHKENMQWVVNQAEQDNVFAQFFLGVYKSGNGEKDGARWIQKAAESGYALAQYALGELYWDGEHLSKNYEEAVKWYRKASVQGNRDAQYSLGICYYYGKGVSQNYEEAVKCFQKAAEQGDNEAMRLIGECYYHGNGVPQNYEEAIQWYQKSAELWNSEAQKTLGNCYYEGRGVTQNYTEAIKWYQKSAGQGNAKAQNNLGNCYYCGNGIAKDYTEAVKWYRKAAEQGNADAQNSLANCYYNGNGVLQNYMEAVKWYQKSTEQRNQHAQYNLGNCYYNGNGVSQNYAKAIEWYRKAAEQNHMQAQAKLGLRYYYGEGTAKNVIQAFDWLVKAINQGCTWPEVQYVFGMMYYAVKKYSDAMEWFQKAADQGYADAQCLLGEAYFNGEGVSQSYSEAVNWFWKAAQQGNSVAQYDLGVCYEYGKGIKSSDTEAKKWYQKAADQGHANALKKVNELVTWNDVKESFLDIFRNN